MDINDSIWNPWHGCHKYSERFVNVFGRFQNVHFLNIYQFIYNNLHFF